MRWRWVFLESKLGGLILFLTDLFKVIIIIFMYILYLIYITVEICLNRNLFFPSSTILLEKVILSNKSGQFYDVAKQKKRKCFGLFHQNLNSCGWLLEIDIFN